MVREREPLVPARKELIDRILLPFQRFLHAQSSGGILLIFCTIAALVWANSSWAAAYEHFWHTEVSVGFDRYQLRETLVHWINDALMAAFFFVVGLEIKRELLVGELASFRQAALPISAAIGGMAVPALLFVAVNYGHGESLRGWGVPMATDIAFAIGVMALLGDRVSLSAKVFLTALAIVDDIGAALVIAVFYTDSVSIEALAAGGVFLAAMIVANRVGVRTPVVYGLLGIGLWLSFLNSGVHPTIAGILAATAIPARTRINADEFVAAGTTYVAEFQEAGETGRDVLTSREQRGALKALENACELAQTPLQRFESRLHPWVMFAIMPLFALANAGVSLGSAPATVFSSRVVWGVVLGLVLGKPLGITACSWLAVKSGIAELPAGVTWRGIWGIGCLAGIGFTMSLFIVSLAFRGSPSMGPAKVGILAASTASAVLGWLIFRSSDSSPVTAAKKSSS